MFIRGSRITQILYTAFGGSCESGTDLFGLIQLFTNMLRATGTMESKIKTVNGKTVYLAKISDKLVTKVNNLNLHFEHFILRTM